MEHTPDSASPRRTSHADKDARVINLRRFWRWRAGLAGLALVFCVAFMGAMTFAGRPEQAPPPRPEVVEAAWQKLVSDTLAGKKPADQPMALPTSEHASIGLLRIRSADDRW